MSPPERPAAPAVEERASLLSAPLRLLRRVPTRTLRRAGVIAAVLIVCGIWISIDRQTPEWDQAHYLDVSLHYVSSLRAGGLGGLANKIWIADPSHPPLFEVSLIVPFLLFGPTPTSALLVNLILWPVLLLSVADITARLYNERAALLAMAITATMPLMVGLSHEVMEDFELTAFVALTIALLLRTRYFSSWRASLLLGLVMGVGAVSKATFVMYVLGPVAVVVVRGAVLLYHEARHPETRGAGLTRLANAGVVLVISVGIAAAWYLSHLQATLAYIRSATGGSLAVGTGPSNPLTLHNIGAFTLGAIDWDGTLLLAVIGVLALVLVLVPWLARRGRGDRSGLMHDMGRAALLVAWIGPPYLFLISSQNQDVRLMAGAFPAVAILIAALVVAIPVRAVRWIGEAALCAAGAILTLGMTWPFTIPLLPSQIAVPVRLGWVYYPISPPRSMGYERVPQAVDYMVPVMNYLEAESKTIQSPRPVVCVLETDPDINWNTLSYLVDENGDSYDVVEVHFYGSASRMQADLEACNMALFVPSLAGGEGVRTIIANAGFAATHMNAADFALFDVPVRSFPIDFGEQVQVLVRQPGTESAP